MWDLQTFETSLKPHLSPAVNTNMGCHFKRDFRNPVSWYHSETFFVAKRAIGWSLLVKSSLVFWVFFSPSALFFFFVKWRSLSRAEVCTNPRAGQRLVCQVPASCDFSKGVGYVPTRDLKVYNGQADRTLFVVPAAAAPAAFAFSWHCCLPTACSQTSRCNNPKMVCVLLNGFTWLSADVTVWDRAHFPWHQPQIWLTAVC